LIGTLPLEPHPQPYFALIKFQIGPHIFPPGPASDCVPPTHGSHVAGIISMCYHVWLIG
jgi:hypothetical protein